MLGQDAKSAGWFTADRGLPNSLPVSNQWVLAHTEQILWCTSPSLGAQSQSLPRCHYLPEVLFPCAEVETLKCSFIRCTYIKYYENISLATVNSEFHFATGKGDKFCLFDALFVIFRFTVNYCKPKLCLPIHPPQELLVTIKAFMLLDDTRGLKLLCLNQGAYIYCLVTNVEQMWSPKLVWEFAKFEGTMLRATW